MLPCLGCGAKHRPDSCHSAAAISADQWAAKLRENGACFRCAAVKWSRMHRYFPECTSCGGTHLSSRHGKGDSNALKRQAVGQKGAPPIKKIKKEKDFSSKSSSSSRQGGNRSKNDHGHRGGKGRKEKKEPRSAASSAAAAATDLQYKLSLIHI